MGSGDLVCIGRAGLELQTDRAFAAAAPQEFQPGKLEQVIPGHYVYSNGARISGIIATSEGVVVLDSLKQ